MLYICSNRESCCFPVPKLRMTDKDSEHSCQRWHHTNKLVSSNIPYVLINVANDIHSIITIEK
jgi:hypothetical protein